MDFDHGFTLLRALGTDKGGEMLAFAALTAIHFTHRIGALLVFGAIGLLVWRLLASGAPSQRHWALALAAVAAWQFASGLSNVVLGWPLAAAIAHTGGAAALVTVLTVMLARAHQARQRKPAAASARGAAAPLSSAS
jgi:cytochrome c oxidase assembly protein subunit 15